MKETPLNVKNLKVESVSVPRQENGCDCGMFVCVYSEMIFKDSQEAFQSKLKKSDVVIEDETKFAIMTVMKSLRQKEKRNWFSSQHVTNMISILKKKINETARAQREQEEEEKEEEEKKDAK